MEIEVGRLKTGELLRINKNKEGYILKAGGETRGDFSDREKAVREAKVLMIKSWLPESSRENIEEMLNSYISLDYNFTLEWCERQADKDHDCDCGCWGYPMEMGAFWTWKKNKYRGCPKCRDDITQKK
ncbi:hypothetical protein [Halarsenatibacter silvermanii]|uniref:Uncharacterized protein n=1 Tax=Halarsenatibacter silvermanii TaxID=321763 RepID=A0A1G9QMP9_9FIRM|nr:hypothetical protein [Halarsenatibacter silvermanii]SDM12190.1 hypothetical protein SAMN04488692_11737 [Halarsenatibacter silvermanii]